MGQKTAYVLQREGFARYFMRNREFLKEQGQGMIGGNEAEVSVAVLHSKPVDSCFLSIAFSH